MTASRSNRKSSRKRFQLAHFGFVLLFIALVSIGGYFLYMGRHGGPAAPETGEEAIPMPGIQDDAGPDAEPGAGITYPFRFKLFFGNEDFNSSIAGCDQVFPVFRETESREEIEAEVVRELLKGPSPTEQGQGYYTALNEGISLRGIKMEGTTAYPDFSRELEKNVAGSCTILAIRAQISETLLQFENIDNVVIMIEGSSAGVLQP